VVDMLCAEVMGMMVMSNR